MSDEVNMRMRLQNVAAYRELCRSVQRSGRENVVFALFMFSIGYYFHTLGEPWLITLLYGILATGELLVGLFKWAAPSAEGLILDAFVLLAFVAVNGWLVYHRFQRGWGISPVSIFFSLYMLLGAINRFKAYGELRRQFAERPASDHLAWFDDLVRDILTADPHADQLAIDLPTTPHWRAKLLGSTVFFVANNGNAVWVAGPDDFTIQRAKQEHSPGHHKAMLRIHGEAYPEFILDDASWANYARWAAEQAAPRPA